MGPYAFSQAFLCGFFAFAALSAIALWWGTRRDRALLLLAGVCIIGSVQAYASLWVSAALTVADAQYALKMRAVCGALNAAALTWLFSAIANLRARRYVWFVSATMAATVALILTDTSILGGSVVGIERATLPWGESFSAFTRTAASPVTVGIYGVIASTIVFNLICARRFMAEDRIGGTLLVVAALGSMAPLLSGIVTDVLRVRLPFFGSIGVVATTVVVALQMLDNRRRQTQLANAERRFHAIFDQTFQFIGLLDVSGRVLEVNRTALAFAAVEAKSVAGRPLWETAWWNHAAELQARVRDAVSAAAGGGIVRFDATHRAADGRVHHVDCSLKPVHDASGAVVLLIAESRDIEDRVIAEDKQRHLEQRLAQSQKMEALGRLAGGVAHDFNNLLTVIAGHVEMLGDEVAGESAQRELRQIRQAAEQAAAMTAELLAFSRQSVALPAVAQPNRVITDTEAMLRRAVGGGVELVMRLSPDVPLVKVDPRQLGRVFVNVAINARDAMPNGGTLVIETRHETSADVGAELGASSLAMIALSDTGTGMDDETKARIFEPFFTTKPSGSGTGLGMAIVDGIVRQAGGYIEVDSAPGRGTTFRVYLPAVNDAAVETPHESTVRAQAGSETILVVEDDAAVRTMTQAALERQGYRVFSATCGPDALALVAEHRGEIDLVLTDVVMPRMSGPQLIERLRLADPDMAALFMSGAAEDRGPRRHALIDEASFLQKPFTPTTLAAKVREILDRHPRGHATS